MDKNQTGRRRMLKRSAIMVASLAAIPVVMSSRQAVAAASKADFHYQDHPKNGKKCSDCAAFVPPQSENSAGTCNIIAGSINPDGWCMAFTSK